jgi:hypothetical protein
LFQTKLQPTKKNDENPKKNNTLCKAQIVDFHGPLVCVFPALLKEKTREVSKKIDKIMSAKV